MDLDKVIQHIFTYRFPTEEQLVQYANARHGFGGDDGSYGVTYPDDIDIYERDISQQIIPEGSVEIYCSAYTDQDILISEKSYLSALKSYLESMGYYDLACLIKNV
jgi:hypothetical protein